MGLLLYSTMLSHGNPLHDWQCSKQQCEMVLKTVLFGPCLMYRDFSDALKHPKIHPRTKLADNLALFVRGPLRVRAPVLPGEVNPLNSAPPLWGGICADNTHPLRLRPRRPVIAIRRRLRALLALYLAAGQAKERTINDPTPQAAQWQKQPCHASKKKPCSLSAGSFHLHRSAGHAHRQCLPVCVLRRI